MNVISTRLRWTLGLVLAFALAVVLVTRTMLTEDLLEGVINGALIPASGDLYYVEIDELDLSFSGRSIRVSGLHLRINEQTLDSLEVLGGAPAIQVRGRLDHVVLDGVDLMGLVRHRDLAAARFLVMGPEVEFTIVEHVATSAPRDRREEDGSTGEQAEPTGGLKLGSVKDLPYVAIDQVRIEEINATMVLVKSEGSSREGQDLESILSGLSLEMENFLVDPSEPVDPSRVAFSDDTRLHFDRLHLELPEMDIDVGPLSTSSRDEALRIERIEVIPNFSEEEFLKGAGPPGDRIELTAGPLSFEGLPYWRIVEDLDVRLASGRIENLQVKVLSDWQRPSELMTDPWMPHGVFQSLPVLLTIDSLQVVESSVIYTERGVKGRKTGSIVISDITGTVHNVSHDPARMTRETPMIVDADARLFGVVPVKAQVQIPLLEPAPTMLLKAQVSSFDPQLVNGILPTLEGIRVTNGVVDTAWVAVEYGPRKARGSVVAIYRDLYLRVEDRDTGQQNLGQGVLSVVANIAVRTKNDPRPGKAPHGGKLNYDIASDAPFFQVFWEAISDGLVNLVANL